VRFPKKTGWWQLKYFEFSALFGEDFQFDDHIFQMGWFNHQPEKKGSHSRFLKEIFGNPMLKNPSFWGFSLPGLLD